jgi:hypothetical protein
MKAAGIRPPKRRIAPLMEKSVGGALFFLPGSRKKSTNCIQKLKKNIPKSNKNSVKWLTLPLKGAII